MGFFWLALGVALAGAASRFAKVVPDSIEVIDVAGVQNVEGIPVTVCSIRSKQSIEELGKFFAELFVREGLYVPPVSQQPQLPDPMFVGLDVNSLVSYTVTLKGNTDHTTTVLLGEADLSGFQKTRSPPLAPVFPAATEILNSSTEGMRRVSYSALATPAQVTEFYRARLVSDGYRETAEGTFRKGAEELKVLIRKAKGGKVEVGLSIQAALEENPGVIR